MKSAVPIPIPKYVQVGEAITAEWANQMRSSIQRLTNRNQPEQNAVPNRVKAQFETLASKSQIIIHSGVLGSTTIDKFTVDTPADGNWYVQSKVTIVNTTGAITNREVICTQTEETNTATVFYSTIAIAVISSTEPCTASNYNYGPLLVFPFGNVTSTWEVLVF